MQLGARGAQRERQATRKLMAYSKRWTPGDTMRVFFPLIWDEQGRPDFLIGKVWGHPVNDVKELGLHTTFIPSLTPFDENGNPVGVPDVTYQFSRIAPIFVNGMRAQELAAIAKKPWPTESQREQAMQKVKEKYDTKNNRNAVRPIIGRAQYMILTEVISAKYIENQGIDTTTIAISSLAMSDQLLQKLWALLDNAKFAPAAGAKYFEAEYIYPADADKGASGRAVTIGGLTPDWSLAAKFPEQFKTIEDYFRSWSTDSETIKTRATTSINPDAIQAAITNYSLMHSEFLDSVDNDDDTNVLLNNIEILSKVIKPDYLQNAELKAKIQEAISKMSTAPAMPVSAAQPAPDLSNIQLGNTIATPNPAPVMPEQPASVPTPQAPVPTAAPTTPEPNIAVNPQAPDLRSLMGDALNIGADAGAQDVLDGFDLSGIG